MAEQTNRVNPKSPGLVIEIPKSKGIGSLATPTEIDDAWIIVHWQAAYLLNSINHDAVQRLVPKLVGSFDALDQIPVIKSYMNMLLILHEKGTDRRWIVRVPYDQNDTRFIHDTVEPLRRVNQKFKKITTPHLHHYAMASDRDNLVGVDFTILGYIEGKPMVAWDETTPSSKEKRKVTEQMAEIWLELLTNPVTRDDFVSLRKKRHRASSNATAARHRDASDDTNCSFNLPPLVTAYNFYHALVDDQIQLAMFKREPVSLLIDFLILRSRIPDYIVPRYNDSEWYIGHNDLHHRNILVGEEDSSLVTGIIDWDGAHPVPLQTAAAWPKYLETPPGAEFPDLPATYVVPDLEKEKAYFLQVFSELEQEQSGSTHLSRLIETSSERTWFDAAIRQEHPRKRWAARYAERTVDNVRRAQDAFYSFLSKPDNMDYIESKIGSGVVVAMSYELEKMVRASAMTEISEAMRAKRQSVVVQSESVRWSQFSHMALPC